MGLWSILLNATVPRLPSFAASASAVVTNPMLAAVVEMNACTNVTQAALKAILTLTLCVDLKPPNQVALEPITLRTKPIVIARAHAIHLSTMAAALHLGAVLSRVVRLTQALSRVTLSIATAVVQTHLLVAC